MLDHSFMLQAIMDLKGTVASLATKVDRLIEDVAKQGDKLDTVRHQISFVKGAIWVIGALLALLITTATISATIYTRLQLSSSPAPAPATQSAPPKG